MRIITKINLTTFPKFYMNVILLPLFLITTTVLACSSVQYIEHAT